MQTSGVLLLFCITAYWVLTETFPTCPSTATLKCKPYNLVKEILSLLNKTSIFNQEQGLVSITFDENKQGCYRRKLEIFINATQKITVTKKESQNLIENIRGNLESIQKFSLPECLSQECNCEEAIIPFKLFITELKVFLEEILNYFSPRP